MADAPKLTDVVPTDALKDAGSKLLGMVVQRAAEAATDRITGLTDRLTGVAENGSGLRDALRGRSDDDGDGDGDGDDEDGENGGDENPPLAGRGQGLVRGGRRADQAILARAAVGDGQARPNITNPGPGPGLN